MINQLTKNIKLFLILLLLSSFVAINIYEPKKSSLVKNILEFETTSDFIPDEIEPFCGGVSYTEANSKSLYDVSYLNINLIDKASWYENLFSIIKESEDYIFENRKKRFRAEVEVVYQDGTICSFPSEIRISGDHQDHIRKTDLATSLDVHLKSGNIGNIVKFKLFLPETRNNDIELVATSIMNKLGFLTPRTFKLDVSLNNQENVTYIFQEKIVKEMIEHNGLRESAILETSEDFFWEDRKLLNPDKPVLFAKLLNNNWVNRSPYNIQIGAESLNKYNKLIFQSDGSYLIYDYLENSTLLEFDTAIFAMDGHHGLAIHNRKFYFDVLNNDLIPIYYDIDSQIEGRDLYVKNCEEELLNAYEEFICVNNFAAGAELLLSRLNFKSEDIKSDLSKKNLNVDNDYVDFIYKRFKENLVKISGISSKDMIFTNQLKNNFKKNYLIDTQNSSIGFYFYNFQNQSYEFCASNLDNCTEKKIEMKSIESPKELDNVQYYFLGSKKINNNLDQEIKEFLIEDDVHIRNYGSLSSINIDSINKSVDIILNKKSKVLIYGTGVLKSWNVNIQGSKETEIDNHRQDNNLLTGCVTFFGIKLENIQINSSDNRCEDAVNLLNVTGDISNIIIKNSYFDGLDIDYSNLKIQNINITNSGNDCLDISSSSIEVKFNYLESCEDKSLSIGEKSFVYIDTFESQNSNIVIAVKDSSNVNIDNKFGSENKMCIAMYRKKEEFGPSRLIIENNLCEGKSENFIQYGQELTIDN